MVEYRRGIKAGILAGVVVYLISSVLTIFLAVSGIYPKEALAMVADLSLSMVIFVLILVNILLGCVVGVVLGVIFAAFYIHLPGATNVRKGIVLSLIAWLIPTILIMFTPDISLWTFVKGGLLAFFQGVLLGEF